MPLTPDPFFTAPTAPSTLPYAPPEALPSPGATHARLVSALVHVLFALGFRNIHSGTHSLLSRTGFVASEDVQPDVTARSGRDTLDVFAVETATSLASAATKRRLKALAGVAETGGAGLWLAVPSEVRAEAAHRLEEWGITARVICV